MTNRFQISNFAFKFNLRRYTQEINARKSQAMTSLLVGRCRLTLSNPR